MDQLLTRPMNVITRCTGLFRDDALADTGLTSGQATYLLRICHKPGLTQEELARSLYVHKSSVTRALAALEGEGWITRVPDAADRRALRVYPTAKAEAIRPRLRAMLHQWSDYLTAELTDAEAAQLHSLLERVALRAEQWAEGRAAE